MNRFQSRTARASARLSTGDTSGGVVVRKHRPDYQIVLFMGLLMMLGLIIIYAIGPQRANVLNTATGSTLGDTYFFVKQIVSLLMALASFAVMAVIPYKWMEKYGTKILIAGFAACVLLALAGWVGSGIALCANGACRWFVLGGLGTLQPAEILKFGVLVFLAGFLGVRARQGAINDLHKTLIPVGIVVAAAMLFVIVIQRDLGTGISLMGIIVAMLMMSGVSKKIGLVLLGALVAAGVMLIITAPHRMERVLTFLQGDEASLSDPNNYHIIHAKIAIGTGGFLGVGVGNSVQATGYLPEAINDSIFAIMGETFGFLGLVVILALFTALLLRLLRVMDHLVDMRLKLVVAGVFGWLAAHVVMNIAAMVGVLPLTGITLPLLSFGGTSMIFIAGALGLAFQLSRYTVHGSKLKTGGSSYENSGSRRGIGRTRDAGRRGASRITGA